MKTSVILKNEYNSIDVDRFLQKGSPGMNKN